MQFFPVFPASSRSLYNSRVRLHKQPNVALGFLRIFFAYVQTVKLAFGTLYKFDIFGPKSQSLLSAISKGILGLQGRGCIDRF